MNFKADIYIAEMKAMIDNAIHRMKKEKPHFEIYSVSIWTDANSSASSVNFDSKNNSDKQAERSNEWSKKYYLKFLADGDLEQAKLFEPTNSRNCSPADFELRDFEEIDNSSIPNNWEEETEGDCWDILDPYLHKVGEYAFEKIGQLNTHPDFELAVNGRQDWYEFTWPKIS